MPSTVGSASTFPLRISPDLQTLHANSRLYYTSFLPSAIRDWDELPEQTQYSPSLLKHLQKQTEFKLDFTIPIL